MTQEEALNHLEHLRFALQRMRSLVAEELPGYALILPGLNKWIWDDEFCPLKQIVAVLDAGRVSGQTFYNFMVVLDRWMPEVKLADMEHKFPAPDMRWCLELE